MNDPDRDRVARFLDRDEAAFSELYDRYTPGLYRTVFRLFSLRQDEAEDVLQEAWLRVARMLAEFQWKSSLKTWLTGVAINCGREYCRRNHGKILDRDGDVASRTGRQAGAVTAQIDLERAFQCLPEGSRQVFFLHDLEGFTHREIAELLGVNEGTSRSQLFKARAKLRKHL